MDAPTRNGIDVPKWKRLRGIGHRQSGAIGLSACSVRTGGFCRARQRLPLEMVSALTRQTGQLLSQKALSQWLWRGRAVKLVALNSTLGSNKTRTEQHGSKLISSAYRQE
jgi:hypothetical protein